MTDAATFLQAFGRAIAASRFYAEDHPARVRTRAESFEQLQRLLEQDERVRFTVLDGEVAYQQRVLDGFREWEWSRRLERAGIRRIEIDREASREEYDRFLEEVIGRLAGGLSSALSRQFGEARIRFGDIAFEGVGVEHTATAGTTRVATGIGAESAAVQWLYDEVSAGRAVPLIEAEIIVRCLATAMHRDRSMLLPLLELRDFDEYTTTHASNVAVLTMALAEYLGFAPAEVRTLGVSGLLHDIGKTRIPRDVLTKPGRLTPEERAVIERHPAEGARMLLALEASLDVASVVAYEHHLLIDGGGYPVVRYARSSHYASQIVHVCDVFDALCTRRPYREAWTTERALSTIESESGTSFLPELVLAFGTMIRSSGQQRTPLQAGAGGPA